MNVTLDCSSHDLRSSQRRLQRARTLGCHSALSCATAKENAGRPSKRTGKWLTKHQHRRQKSVFQHVRLLNSKDISCTNSKLHQVLPGSCSSVGYLLFFHGARPEALHQLIAAGAFCSASPIFPCNWYHMSYLQVDPIKTPFKQNQLKR